MRRLRLFAAWPLLLGATPPLPMPPLPEPVTNNAVAGLVRAGRLELYSFLGLGPSRTWREVTAAAWRWREGEAAWTALPPVPGEAGRLAAAACAVGGQVYVFGGYTVDEQGAEVSTPGVQRLDPATGRWEARAAMPVPVDDSVALPHADRYIYLVSGWHDTGNTNLVQCYDTRTDTWARATDYPGVPVFGHAGGLSRGTMLVAGGVRVLPEPRPGARYAAANECWLGAIDPEDPHRIRWRAVPPPAPEGRYRMAAVGTPDAAGRIIFAGGTARPYNYNGIGYDGVPSEASAEVFVFDVGRGAWLPGPRVKAEATMDHRGLVVHAGRAYVLGGMGDHQTVRADITSFPVEPEGGP